MSDPGSPSTSGALSPDAFRDVIGRFASGVTVVTAWDDGQPVGTTASAVSSLSLDPPMMLVCLNQSSNTSQAILRSGAFAVSILSEDQQSIASVFATKAPDKFRGIGHVRGRAGQPVLPKALATIECSVADQVVAGTHVVFLANVLTAGARSGAPLAYFGGRFGRLDMADTAEAYRIVRQQILDGTLPPAAAIEARDLAQALSIPPAPLHLALGRLAADGLVQQTEEGLTVTRVDWPAFTDALDARKAIELGVAALTVGQLSDAQLGDLRAATSGWTSVSGGEHVALGDRHLHSIAFHDVMVGLAGSQRLVSVYQQLELPSMLTRTFHDYQLSESDEAFGDEHRELVASYESSDLARARDVIARHVERIKAQAAPLLT